ncbi:hypothetical protein MRX96_004650 [Rhipicephalus microplus]
MPLVLGRRRASVGTCSCTFERSGGISADVLETRSFAFYRHNHDSPFVLRRSYRVQGGPAVVGSGVLSAWNNGAVVCQKPAHECVAPFVPTSATWPTVQGRGVGVRWAQPFVTGCRFPFRRLSREKLSPRPNGVSGRNCQGQTQLRRSTYTIQ